MIIVAEFGTKSVEFKTQNGQPKLKVQRCSDKNLAQQRMRSGRHTLNQLVSARENEGKGGITKINFTEPLQHLHSR